MTRDKKIFDCFIFYNESDILKMRLQEMYEFVDYFVICEATRTFRGKPKPLYFHEARASFSEFADKIIHVVVDDLPEADADPAGQVDAGDPLVWGREHAQRNALRCGLAGAEPDDIVIISDCDEIIRPQTIAFMRQNTGYFLLDMPMYQFYLNMQALSSGWRKPFAYTYALDAQIPDYNTNRTSELACFEAFAGNSHLLRDAGWHFTFLGGKEQVRDKLAAYSHTDGWQREMWDDGALSEQMVALREVGGAKPLRFCRIDETFPRTIRENLDRYRAIGFVKDEWERFQELEALWVQADSRRQEVAGAQAAAAGQLSVLRNELRRLEAPPAVATNLILSSADFSSGWDGGVQSRFAEIDAQGDVPAALAGNAVMSHWRDPDSLLSDTNVGYFRHVPIEGGQTYVASCLVWLPEDFAGQAAGLFFADWPGQQLRIANLDRRGMWQRVMVTAAAPAQALSCHVILRVRSGQRCLLHSTCWQLEEGDRPGAYRGTGGPAA